MPTAYNLGFYKKLLRHDWIQLFSLLCCRKKAKSNLETLSGQLDILRDMPNGASRPVRMVAPAGVERFSDDEEEFNATDLSAAYG